MTSKLPKVYEELQDADFYGERMDIPTVPQLQIACHMIWQTLQNPDIDTRTMQRILATLEACTLAMKDWYSYVLGGWESKDIEKYGALLASLDDRLTRSANDLILRSDVQSARGHFFPVIDTLRQLFSELHDRNQVPIL